MSLASDLNALSRASPFPDSATLSTPSEPTAHRAPDVDGPDYMMRWKFAIPAYLLELGLSAGVVAGAYFFARKYALDEAQLWLMMACPALVCIGEAARVPLCIAAQTNQTFWKRGVAGLLLVASLATTAFSVVQLANETFAPRLRSVRDAQAKLALAEEAQAAFAQKKRAAAEDVARAKNNLEAEQTRIGEATKGIVALSGAVHRAGDARARAITLSLNSGTHSVKQASADWIKRRAILEKLDSTAVDRAVVLAREGLHEAKATSQPYLIYATLNGTQISDVNDANVSAVMRLMLGLPALTTSCLATVFGLLAVQRRREPQPAAVPVEAAVEIAAILGDQWATRAADKLRAELSLPPSALKPDSSPTFPAPGLISINGTWRGHPSKAAKEAAIQ